MNYDTAQQAIKLYHELQDLDGKLRAMKAKQPWSGTPLNKVTFYGYTSTYSGPRDYVPKHNAKAICKAIVTDMMMERVRLGDALLAIGYEFPQFNPKD